MRNFLKKSIIISAITLLSSLVITASIIFLSRNTLGISDVEGIFLKVDYNRKISGYAAFSFCIECITCVWFLFFIEKMNGQVLNKINSSFNMEKDIFYCRKQNINSLNINVKNIPLRN